MQLVRAYLLLMICVVDCSGYGGDAITSYGFRIPTPSKQRLVCSPLLSAFQDLSFSSSTKIPRIFKRTPFGLQKDSFCSAKGLLLESKRTRFAVQKDSFWRVKGLVLQCKRTPFFRHKRRMRLQPVICNENVTPPQHM